MQPISSLLPQSPHANHEQRSKPPLLVMQGRDPANTPRFSPTARLIITPYLRTSGLLSVLPDEAALTLLALLTFLTPDGRLQANAPQIAVALGVSDRKGQERMERLTAISWKGQPVAMLIPRATGGNALALPPHMVSFEEEQTTPRPVSAPVPLAGREAVMSHSRTQYARPRAEVEQMVRKQLGYPATEEENTPEAQVRLSMRAFGLVSGEMDELFSRFPIERIERQISWMGYRKARRPRSYLIAAIENDYAPPVEVRLTSQESTEPAFGQTGSAEPERDNPSSNAN